MDARRHAQAEYSYTDLGAFFEGGWSRAHDINNAGQVVGWAHNQSPGTYHEYDWETGKWIEYQGTITVQNAFLHEGGSLFNLGWSDESSRAYGINEAGRVVGSVGFAGNTERAFRSQYGPLDETVDESFFHPVIQTSFARAINDSNRIVGNTYVPSGHAGYIYEHNQMRDLGDMLGAPSWTRAINNHGLAVGDSFVNANYTGPIHAVVHDTKTDQTTDLGVLARNMSGIYVNSYAWDINDAGQVVGWSVVDTPAGTPYLEHAFLYSNGEIQDLGTLPGATRSEAYGINERGDVVGRSGFHAFLYTDGQMWNLNDLVDMPEGWRLEMATEINDLGQIVGYAVQTTTRIERAFLLTAIPSSDLLQVAADTQAVLAGESLAGTFSARYYPVPLNEPIPEPAAGALLLIASAALLRRNRRHD